VWDRGSEVKRVKVTASRSFWLRLAGSVIENYQTEIPSKPFLMSTWH
jgi:hypothetical protein